MRYVFLIALIVLKATSAFADGENVSQDVATPKIFISKDVCENLQKEQPEQKNEVVGADYVAQKDVYGRKVVSANVSDNKVYEMKDVISVPIDVDIASRYGLDDKHGLNLGKVNFGGFVVFKNGKYYIDDKKLSQKDEQMIIDACKNASN